VAEDGGESVVHGGFWGASVGWQ